MTLSGHPRDCLRAPLSGLSAAEAELRLRRDGPNELPGQRPRNLLVITREVITEPMFLLLLGASSIYVVLGDVREALILAASILVIIAITVVQERRTERALAALRDLSSPRALVIRDGMEHRIAGRDVVVDDVILLREGDRVPADAVILSSTALSVDESILTGESLAVDKVAAVDSEEEFNRVYSGSLIVRGFGAARVAATGARSEIGKIGRALLTLKSEPTPLYREVRKMVRWVALGALLLCCIVAVAYALSRGDWLGGVLAGITLAMGVLPEEFPVVLTVFLALGAWRISRANVLTRRMPAVESIGAATVLAVDKTGTLTENRMKVALLETPDASVDLRSPRSSLHENAELLLAVAFAASERDAFDPMERAIHEAARQSSPSAVARLESMELAKEYDLTPELLAVTHVWRNSESRTLRVAAKGAPEAIADLCRLDSATREHLLQRVAAHAQQGLRVLAVAEGTAAAEDLPETARGFQLRLLGLLCLADPLRADVPAALAECRQAGIRVVMITGDHPGTALAIASQAGFDTGGGVLTGVDLERASDDELRAHARTINIYARAKPEHKLRLVQAFKVNGEVIAMTGDGVNDAPALRAAHVGVAMGGRGTDVAREAAALVLVNDDFASLVTAVRLGRRIYSNIRHAMSYIVAVHIPIAGLGLLPVLFGWPLLFMPVHVLFLEFVIDPACAFVFEADKGAPDLMRRKPRPPDEALFSRDLLGRSLSLGFGVLVLCVAVYAISLRLMPPEEARALAFLAIVVCNLSLIFVSRSRSETLAAIFSKPNRIYWWIVALAGITLLVAIGVPAVADVFQFSRPPWNAVVAVTAGALSCVLTLGLLLRNR
ncbi:MAG TPA: cation-translocating P-type ATPase [Steroidobacteraceae bacterium]|jgi:ATPase, P-type (transporting), HAD superfamily, subfamily IC|nr:cation-translocating P-type ATPase [Steroidobacteraceae bacterium]